MEEEYEDNTRLLSQRLDDDEDFSKEEEFDSEDMQDDMIDVASEQYDWPDDCELVNKAEEAIADMNAKWGDIYTEAEECWDVYNLDQWTPEQKLSRGNRPMVTEDFTRPYIKQVISNTFQNPSMIKLAARSEGSSLKAKALSETLRYIEDTSNAPDAKSWAVECAAVGGFGWIKAGFTTDSTENGGASMVTVDKISDPFSVMIDDKSVAIDGSDAKYLVEYIDIEEDHYIFYYKDEEDNVLWVEIKADEVINKSVFPAKFIPVVPVFGEYTTIAGNTNCFGMIKLLKDMQRTFNYIQSDVLERIALTPIVPIMVDEDALSPEQELELRNAPANPSTLIKYKSSVKSASGTERQLAPPTVTPNTPNVSYASVILGQLSASANSATGIYDKKNLQTVGVESGIAIQKRLEDNDRGQLVYDSHLKTSDKHLGRILLDLIQNVLAKTGELPIQNEKGENRTILVSDVPPIDFATGEVLPHIPDANVSDTEISISTQPAYATRKEEGIAKVIDLMQKLDPAEQAKIVPEIMRGLDFPGADRFADILQGTTDKMDPMAMQQQMAQMAQQLQQATAKIAQTEQSNVQLIAEIKTNRGAILEKARMDNQTKINLKNMEIDANNNIKFSELKVKDQWHNGDLSMDYTKEKNKAEIETNKLEANADKQTKDIAVKAIENMNNDLKTLEN